MHNQVVYIEIDNIKPNEYQPRKCFNQEALEELAQSIKEYGVIQPITVRRFEDIFEIVAGERRWRASKLAGIKQIPCVIIDITNTESAEIALLENLQREDLNFIEEAEAYYSLINEHKFTQEKIAEKMGKKQSTIANKLRLLKLSEEIRRRCIEGSLTERHTRALLSLPTEDLQKEAIQTIIRDSLTVKKTEEFINRILLKLVGEDLSEKKDIKNIKGVFPTKIYINSIKEIFDKFKIPAKYIAKDCGDSIQIIVTIAKNQK